MKGTRLRAVNRNSANFLCRIRLARLYKRICKAGLGFALQLFYSLVACPAAAEPGRYLSHPPLRPIPAPSSRPRDPGPAHFADPLKGDDKNEGTEERPWRTLGYALKQLKPGDTLYLRAGVFHETVYCAIEGRPDARITIRSFPGEQAVIDGGIPEFQHSPAEAWKPFPDGAPDEYISTRPFPNIRDVVGLFGDSNIGLQTYWHVEDLRSNNEFAIYDQEKKISYRGSPSPYLLLPMYCGPGIWYNRESGHIHARLAHTKLAPPQISNYQGETDPRNLPLVIAGFNSVPLYVDMARHVRFQDLVLRGGGYRTVNLVFGVNIEFDNCTIFCGTYGIWSKNTGPMKMTNCGVHGMIPPWATMSENALHTYSPRYHDPFLKDTLPLYCETPLPEQTDSKLSGADLIFYSKTPHPLFVHSRNIARLPTHALLVTEGGYEFEVFYYPFNHDWDISYCEFTDGHDGVYPNGHHIRFHHNWVDRIQDDGMYLSSPTPYTVNETHVYQNLFTRVRSAFGLHSRGGPKGDIYVYRNIVDLREGILVSRPSPEKPEGTLSPAQVLVMHGSDWMLGIESLYWYHNTFISPAGAYAYSHGTALWTNEKTIRRSFNNLFVYLNGWFAPVNVFDVALKRSANHDIQVDGNLHWCANPEAKVPENLLEKAMKCECSEFNKKNYPQGWDANSAVADPKFVQFDQTPKGRNDYRLQPESPAVGKGIVLPAEWEDPLRPKDGAKPDIGAVPSGGELPKVGRYGRIVPGLASPER